MQCMTSCIMYGLHIQDIMNYVWPACQDDIMHNVLPACQGKTQIEVSNLSARLVDPTHEESLSFNSFQVWSNVHVWDIKLFRESMPLHGTLLQGLDVSTCAEFVNIRSPRAPRHFIACNGHACRAIHRSLVAELNEPYKDISGFGISSVPTLLVTEGNAREFS